MLKNWFIYLSRRRVAMVDKLDDGGIAKKSTRDRLAKKVSGKPVVGMKDRLEIGRLKMRAILAGKKPADSRHLNKKQVGKWVGRLQEAQTKYPNNAIRQVHYILSKGKLIAATGRDREVSERTMTGMGDTLSRAVVALAKAGMPVRNIGEIGKKHVLTLIKYWEAKNNKWETMTTRISHMRRYCQLTNKPGTVPVRQQLYRWLDDNGVKVHQTRGTRIAETSDAWTANGVSPQKVIEQISQKEPMFALLLELQLAFGLRKDESISMEPRASDEGTKMIVTKGTKGGRPRTVDFDADPVVAEWQRDLVERAKVVAMQHPQRRLCKPGLTNKQMYTWMGNQATKYGITEKNLGVTMHGLRHEFVSRVFTQRCGLPPQVEGSVPADVYEQHKEAVKEARLYVSEQVGHWREDITSSYLGSTPRLKKLARQRMGDWVNLVERHQEVMREIVESGVDRFWLVGKAGMGLVMLPGTPLEVQIHFGELDDQVWRRLEKLEQRLSLQLGRVVRASIARDTVAPNDSLEIFIPKVSPVNEAVRTA
jgi:site-specific recombinase XerC